MCSSSSGRAWRLAAPITSRRTELWPTSVPTLIPSPDAVSASNQSAIPRTDDPQLPVTIVVTPSSRKLSARGFPWMPLRRDDDSTWVWTSMKPGARTSPPASTVFVASASGSEPTNWMRPSRTPTSARNHGLPVPSTTRAPTMSRSRGSSSAEARSPGRTRASVRARRSVRIRNCRSAPPATPPGSVADLAPGESSPQPGAPVLEPFTPLGAEPHREVEPALEPVESGVASSKRALVVPVAMLLTHGELVKRLDRLAGGLLGEHAPQRAGFGEVVAALVVVREAPERETSRGAADARLDRALVVAPRLARSRTTARRAAPGSRRRAGPRGRSSRRACPPRRRSARRGRGCRSGCDGRRSRPGRDLACAGSESTPRG